MLTDQINVTAENRLKILSCCYHGVGLGWHLDEDVHIAVLMMLILGNGTKQTHRGNAKLLLQLGSMCLQYVYVFLSCLHVLICKTPLLRRCKYTRFPDNFQLSEQKNGLFAGFFAWTIVNLLKKQCLCDDKHQQSQPTLEAAAIAVVRIIVRALPRMPALLLPDILLHRTHTAVIAAEQPCSLLRLLSEIK